MKRYTIVTIIIAFLCSNSAFAQEMTVEEAIQLGLENNYAIRIARNSAAVTANDKGKGIAGFLPVIDSNGGYRY
ncbi:MAG: TolC family protein, partial [Deltaproteobacteria bacterium]|nr:TolC family protein [Deltaproteobacteria bacterium]